MKEVLRNFFPHIFGPSQAEILRRRHHEGKFTRTEWDGFVEAHIRVLDDAFPDGWDSYVKLKKEDPEDPRSEEERLFEKQSKIVSFVTGAPITGYGREDEMSVLLRSLPGRVEEDLRNNFPELAAREIRVRPLNYTDFKEE